MSLKVIEPLEVTESILTSSDIAEPDLSAGEVEWIANNYDGAILQERISQATRFSSYQGKFHSVVDIAAGSSHPAGAFSVYIWNLDGSAFGAYYHLGYLTDNLNYNTVAGEGSTYLGFVGLNSGGSLVAKRSSTLPTSFSMDSWEPVIQASPLSSSTHKPTRVYDAVYIGSDLYVLIDSASYETGIACAIIDNAGTVSIQEVNTNGLGDVIPIGISSQSSVPVIIFNDSVNLHKITYAAGDLTTVSASDSFKPEYPSASDQYIGYCNISGNNYSLILDKMIAIEIKPDFSILYGYSQGDEVIKKSTHRRYRNLVNGNLVDPQNSEYGATGTIDATWLDVGPTNKWAAFDEKVTTKTSSATNYTIVLNPVTYINTIAFFGLENVDSVDIEVKDSLNNVVYTNTLNTINTTPIYDFYTWVFYQLALTEETIDDELIPKYNSTIKLTFNGTDLSVGLIALGFSNEIGRVLTGTKSETLDYSDTEYDDFGEITEVLRPIVNLNTYEILSDKSYNPYIQSLIKKLRGKNTLWVGDIGGGQKLITYGRYERSPIPFEMPNDVKYSITVRGSI